MPDSLVSSNLSRTVAIPTSILSTSRLSASTSASVAVDATETVLWNAEAPTKVERPETYKLAIFACFVILISSTVRSVPNPTKS